MASYRFALTDPLATLVPCSFVPSREPGKTVCVEEDGRALVVDPTGAVDHVPADDPNFDSPYTQADLLGDLLVYRSTFPSGAAGKPVAFRVVK